VSHLVLIPSYNTGERLRGTVLAALSAWAHVWVVVDGSDDGSDRVLDDLVETHPSFKLIRKADNGGKGAAVLHASVIALEAGFTHALVRMRMGNIPLVRLNLCSLSLFKNRSLWSWGSPSSVRMSLRRGSMVVS
jgi:hypothetical protein